METFVCDHRIRADILTSMLISRPGAVSIIIYNVEGRWSCLSDVRCEGCWLKSGLCSPVVSSLQHTPPAIRLLCTRSPPLRAVSISSLRVFLRSLCRGVCVRLGLPRCKNLTKFSLFVSYRFAVSCCLKCFVFFVLLHSCRSFTVSYTEVEPYVKVLERTSLFPHE